MFQDALLRNKIQEALNQGAVTIPDGKKVAFVISADTKNGGEAKAAFVVKTGNYWQVESIVDWSHDSGAEAGVTVSWSK